MVERYYNEKGEMGVLLSKRQGYGFAGWRDAEMAIDERVINKFLEKPMQAQEFCSFLESLGYGKISMDQYEYKGLTLEFVPKGSIFTIVSDDGYEEISIVDLNNGYFKA